MNGRDCFDSILVRLKGYTITMKILYAILSIRVKSISLFSIFKVDLLSTSGCANSLGGRQHQTGCGFIVVIA